MRMDMNREKEQGNKVETNICFHVGSIRGGVISDKEYLTKLSMVKLS
jgi:hypothetical protein